VQKKKKKNRNEEEQNEFEHQQILTMLVSDKILKVPKDPLHKKKNQKKKNGIKFKSKEKAGNKQYIQSLNAAFSVPLGINTYFSFTAILLKSLSYVAFENNIKKKK
jgi:hypothetical protein